jgi:hypothetical protein
MTTFKEFLTEKIIKVWTSDKVSTEVAIDLLNAHCKDGLKAVANGGLLMRGFERLHGDAVLINSTNTIRTSKDTNNLYQLMMETSSELSDVPKRSNSFICSTNANSADAYGPLYYIVPFDGTTLAIASEPDFIHTSINNQLLGSALYDVQDISYIASFLSLFGIKPTAGKFTDANKIDNELAKISNEMFFFGWTAQIADSITANLKLSIAARDVISKMRGANGAAVGNNTRNKHILENEFKTLKLTAEAQKIFNIIKSFPTDQRFTALSSFIMTHRSIDIKIAKSGDALPNDVEVWFSGQAVAISEKLFETISREMKKQGFKIHTRYKL